MDPNCAYPRKSELKRCKGVQEFLKFDIFLRELSNFLRRQGQRELTIDILIDVMTSHIRLDSGCISVL